MNKPNQLIEWVFIALMFLPVIIMGRLRLHQQNLALFLILSIVLITLVTLAYLHYCRKWNLMPEDNQESKELSEAEAALEERGIQED